MTIKVGKVVRDLIFPPRCPVCDRPVRISDHLACRECREALKYIGPPYCLKCGKHIDKREEEYCYDCMHKQHNYDRGMALYEYTGIQSSVFRFKYQGRKEYAEFYGEEIAKHLGSRIKALEADALIPVPLYRRKKRIRGYNQAEALARQIGKQMQIPVRTDIVERVRKTIPQKELNDKQRQNNLKKAFKITRNDVKLSTIIIIDDIYTTGSTIDEIARVLKQAGAKKIYYIALCIGEGL